MVVDELLALTAARSPDKTALICGDRRLSYADVNRECDRVVALLRAGGLQRGDRVAIHLDNSVEAVVAIFATLRVGAAFVVVNSTVKAAKLNYMLNDCRASALFCDGRRVPMLDELRGATPHLRTVVSVGGKFPAHTECVFIDFSSTPQVGRPDSPGSGNRIDIDLAALVYTSGSTGYPKGIMLTHLNITSAAESIASYLENTEDDVILSVLSLAFTYGLYQVLMAFKLGATVVLERSFAYPHPVLETVAREGVTGLPIVPTIAAMLLQLDLDRYDLTNLRYMTNAGAALPTPHITELRRRLPHVRLYSMYGLTECARVSYLPPDEIDARPDSVGKGMPNQEMYIVDEDGRRLASGVGELVIRGAHVMKGYWELPDETDRVLQPGPCPASVSFTLATSFGWTRQDTSISSVERTTSSRPAVKK